jgi:hypothetical protein
MACGAEMLLMQSVQDNTMAVAGFEHHTYMCSGCHDVERRLVFSRPDEQGGPLPVSVPAPEQPVPEQPVPEQPVPEHTAPPISPAAIDQIERPAPPGILRRVFTRFRGGST